MMKRALTSVAVLSLLVCAQARAEGEKKSIAIIPFESPNDHSLGEMGPNAVEFFQIELLKSGKVKLFERNKLDKIMNEHALNNLTGFVDPATIKKKLGKLVPVDYLLLGK